MNDAFTGFSIIVEFLLPLLAALVFCIVLVVRIMRKELADYEHPRASSGLEPEAKPSIFLRHLNSPQRAYLHQQRRWIAGYIFGSWLSLVFFVIGLGGGREELNSYWNLGWCAFLAVIFAHNSDQQKVLELRFIRTRPLTLCFLFWSRTGVALTSLLTAIATAALGLFLMLRISYGPVWSQAPSILDAPEIAKQKAYILISALQTSPLQPFLSLLTTTALVFSLVVAVGNLYWRLIANSSSKFALIVRYLLWASLLFVPIPSFIQGTYSSRFARILFQYNNAGPPASYAYALVPIAIAAALLRLAQFFNERRETS